MLAVAVESLRVAGVMRRRAVRRVRESLSIVFEIVVVVANGEQRAAGGHSNVRVDDVIPACEFGQEAGHSR